tara:strand:- start:6910 stop:7608 length:699 start_codon:yes stop_codon:yes gene_type:complete
MINHPADPNFNSYHTSHKINYDPGTIMLISAGVSAASSIMGGQAAMEAGKYQQTMAERNADIYESKADQALAIGERNVTVFNKSFAEQQAATETAYMKAGVKMAGTPLEIMEYNLTEAEMERQNILYDSQVMSHDARQQAVMARMEGNVAMFNARSQRAAAFMNAAGTMAGAWATNSLLNTQANNASVLNQKIYDQQKQLINISQNNMKRTIQLQISNAEKLHNKYGTLLTN